MAEQGRTPHVDVIRHWKERVSKCSLRFLHDRPGFTFHRARPGFTFDASGFTLLAVDAPPLTLSDAGRPLLLLDSTWRHLEALRRCVVGTPVPRSIPGQIKTAYPRASKVFDDPAEGLASLEALYVALRILGHEDRSLLEGYHWKDEFLRSAGNGIVTFPFPAAGIDAITAVSTPRRMPP